MRWMLKQRGRPVGGYNNDNKRVQRGALYDIVRRTAPDVSAASALLLPAKEADEVVTALAAGFPRSRLYLVDHDPIAARALRSLYGKGAHAAVVIEADVVEACRIIASQNVGLTLINLDLCGPICCSLGTKGTNDRLAEISRLPIFAPLALLAVTISIGHESRDWMELPADSGAVENIPHLGIALGSKELFRLAILAATVRQNCSARVLLTGKHRSVGAQAQNILWMIFELRR
jgi:hypothetical protein